MKNYTCRGGVLGNWDGDHWGEGTAWLVLGWHLCLQVLGLVEGTCGVRTRVSEQGFLVGQCYYPYRETMKLILTTKSKETWEWQQTERRRHFGKCSVIIQHHSHHLMSHKLGLNPDFPCTIYAYFNKLFSLCGQWFLSNIYLIDLLLG